MGEALSFPEEGTDTNAHDAALSPGGNSVPNEGVLLSQLIQLLSQRPRHSLLLSDLGALLPGLLRQRVKDHGGLRSWLQRYQSLFVVSGQPGKESVRLILGALQHQMCGEDNLEAEDIAAALAGDAVALAAEPCSPEAPASGASPGGGGAAPSPADAEVSAPFDEEVDGLLAVQLRGLPYRATVEDVRTFLGDFVSQMIDNGIHLVLNRDGRPSGFARVQFTTPEAARQCRDDLHLRSMEDRYVEVFLYSERPSKGRRRGGNEEGATTTAGDAGGAPGSRVPEVAGVTREQVVRECRAEMAEPKKRRLLLSMLGVALSPGARSYLKQMDQGLKHFLAQFPGEFSVEGGKGCEYVTYAPTGMGATIQLSEALDGIGPCSGPGGAASAASFSRPAPAVASSAAAFYSAASADNDLLVSPKPSKTPPAEPTPSGGRGLQTPSDWGTPCTAPWGSTPWLPPWPAPTTAGLPSVADNAAAVVAASAAFGAPPAWSMSAMPPPQFWPGWTPNQFMPWGAPTGLEAASHQPLPSALSGTAAPFAAQTAPEAQVVFGAANPTAGTGGATLQHLTTPTATAAPAMQSTDSGGKGNAALAVSVRLRGLPFSATEQDVLAFFAQHDIVDRITDGPKAVNLLLRSNGRPSGQAVVQMRDRADAELSQRVLHGQWMGSRYIEVFLYGEDGSDSLPAATPAGTSAGATAGVAAPPAVTPSGGPAAPPTSSTAPRLGGAAAAGAVAAQALQQLAAQQPPAAPPLSQAAAAAAAGFLAGSLGPGTSPSFQVPWAAVPWGAMPTGMPGGLSPSGNSECHEASWEALFEFLGPEGMAAAAAAAAGAGAPPAVSGGPGFVGPGMPATSGASATTAM